MAIPPFGVPPTPNATATVAGKVKQPLTTKGDILTYSTVPARLAAGANGKILQADSTQTTGLSWADQTTVSLVKNEVPGGLVNSSNTSYTTAAAYQSGSLRVYQNGIRLKGGGVDFTEGSSAFTMATAPTTGDILLVDYDTNTSVFATGSTSFIYNETPSGTVNGSNAVFTTAFAYVAGSTQVYRDGQLMKPGGADYTETTPSSGTITFVTAPVTNSVILVSYQKSVSTAGNADTVDGYHANATPTLNQIPVLDGSALLPAATIPKASGANVTTGTSDVLFVTPKALADATVGKLGAAWTTFTPSWTNLTVGTGGSATNVGSYCQIGKFVSFHADVKFGTSGNSMGTGPTLTLPVGIKTLTGGTALAAIGQVVYVTAAGVVWYGWIDGYGILRTFTISTYPTLAQITASQPFTWASGDYLSIYGTYEAA